MEFKKVSQLPIDIKETIKKRVSSRSFKAKSLNDGDKNKLLEFNKTLSNPFGVDIRVQYVSKDTSAEKVQLGTYGTIKGAKDFLTITVKDIPFASATNAQPWAVVKEGSNFHFFCNYKNSINDDMKKIKHLDLGIALSHFHQTAMSEKLIGNFEIQDIHFSTPENMHYIISYSSK